MQPCSSFVNDRLQPMQYVVKARLSQGYSKYFKFGVKLSLEKRIWSVGFLS